MELIEGIHKALNGNALLFVGAGFSLGAKDLNGDDFITGSKLAELLAKACGLSSGIPLEDVSEYYTRNIGIDKLIDLLRTKFSTSQVSSFHRTIAQIPWKRIYTTNYDNVLEQSYRIEARSITPITIGTDIYKIPKNKTLCVHLNGYIDKLDRETIFNELKLTETSYITNSIENSMWVTDFRSQIDLAEAIFFLGFSLYDLDIRRILRDSTSLREKCFFVIGEAADEITKMRVSRFGIPLNISVEKFSAEIAKEKEVYQPVERAEFSPLSITEHFLNNENVTLSDRDFFDFLLFGTYKESQISESVRSNGRFYLERHQIDTILSAAQQGDRFFTLSSDFGNGKSLFLEGLYLKFLENGFRVFHVREHSSHTNAELEQIAKLEDRVLIAFEQYSRWLNEIELFCLNSSNNAVIVMTERSSSHDLILDTLEQKLGNHKVYETNLDKLNETEIKWFLEVFDHYGIWGEYAGSSNRKKRQYLEMTCRGQIHAILLKLLDSPNIKDKLSQLSSDIKKNSTHFDILLSIFILTIINHYPNLSLLSDIWGAELINRTNFRRDPAIQQFINFESDEIKLKSPIVSEYFIHNFADANKIVSVLLTLARRTDKLTLSKRYTNLFKDLMKFSNVQSILPHKGLRQGAIDFYENIKNLEQCKRNPLFWLQYAIACTTTLEITRARTYFSTANSLATQKGWDLFQIDNHYAKFLIVEAIENLPTEPAMDNFRKAHSINRRQINSIDRMRYPFRNATTYRPFFDKFKLKLGNSQINELKEAFQFILEKIMLLPEDRQKLEPMKTCKQDMESLIQQINFSSNVL